jgi:D-lactate dehydrogenase (cytochrome)
MPIQALKNLLSERLLTQPTVVANYGRDESPYPAALPFAVCLPESVDEVVEIVRICREAGMPMIPFGAGSSLEGGILPTRPAISLSLERMNRIVNYHPHDFSVSAQAGVTRLQLNAFLQTHGQFFSVDPGANATLGGMASTRASGTNTVRYASMRENVLALQVVLADGQVIRTGKNVRKSAAGYDLTRLFVGAEGTLGIITEVTVRLYPQPAAIAAAMVSFPSIAQALGTVQAILQAGIPIARLELLDEVAIGAVNQYAGLALAVQPTLFLEFHGSQAEVTQQSEQVQQFATQQGGSAFRWALAPDERAKLWQARHNAYHAAKALRPNCRVVSTDVCVPLSQLETCLLETKADILHATLPCPLVGHVGDGNFHVMLVVENDNAQEYSLAQEINQRLVARAQRLGGTCSGEHGIGLGKRKFMQAEHGPAIHTMQLLKHSLDPQNLFNPGKVLPDAV